MTIRPKRWIAPCLLAMVPMLATAAEPAVSATSLGQLESIRDFCDKVDPNGAKVRQTLISSLVSQVSAADLAAARESDEYKHAYEMSGEQLTRLEPKAATSSCSTQVR